ncbi:MAG: hypothetical protein SCK57_13335 [Bacillota bacterium]|nr:hypothetical protein [Bacillota bacterium]MDW7678636.1 hypothetical protein [Bacillota bacterium]
MKSSEKKQESIKKTTRCGVVTCIHRVMDTCTLDVCDLQERMLLQES